MEPMCRKPFLWPCTWIMQWVHCHIFVVRPHIEPQSPHLRWKADLCCYTYKQYVSGTTCMSVLFNIHLANTNNSVVLSSSIKVYMLDFSNHDPHGHVVC